MLSNPRHSTSTLKRAVDAVFGSRRAPLLSVALIIAAAHPLAAQEGPDEAILREARVISIGIAQPATALVAEAMAQCRIY